MPDHLCARELHREASILLHRLEKGRGYLLKSDGAWQVFSAKNAYRQAVSRSSQDIVDHLRKEGSLCERPGGGLIPISQAHGFHRETDIPGETRLVRNEAECALGWLRSRRDASGNPMIGDEQFAAAEILRRDYTAACLEARVTQRWDWDSGKTQWAAGTEHARVALTDRAVAAKQRVFAALEIVGPELSGILLEICCLASGLEHAERALGLPQRSGKPILQLALTRLARHYGLLPPDELRRRHAALRQWGRDDYRPSITI
ncbi:hypothetical protein BH10PSE7_BH10PSE7_23450 [soil metagenome]